MGILRRRHTYRTYDISGKLVTVTAELSHREAIAEFCKACANGAPSTIRNCESADCPLYIYRPYATRDHLKDIYYKKVESITDAFDDILKSSR